MSSGQSTLETLIALTAVVPAFAWGGLTIWEQFQRLNCERQLFENTRSRLASPDQWNLNPSIHYTQSDQGIEGRIQCGKYEYRVFLKWVDRW